MRKIIVSEFISLDGVIEDPGGAENFEHGGWTTPYWSEDIGRFKSDELMSADTLLLGRITYEGFAKAWPELKGRDGYSTRFNTMEKVVVSDTMQSTAWENSRILHDADAVDEIKHLKQSEGGDILIFGSGELIRSLMPLSLIDEFRLLIYPVVIGSGKQLFGGRIFARLNLVETKILPKSVVLMRYDLNLKE